MRGFRDSSSSSSSSASSHFSPPIPSPTSSASSPTSSPTSFKFNPEANLFIPQSEGESSDTESVHDPKTGLTQTELDAEWTFYAAGRVKTFGSRRRGVAKVESSNKDAFGPHYKTTQMLFQWMDDWELRDEAHKQLCVAWVRGDGNPVTVQKPGMRESEPVEGGVVEDVPVASSSGENQGWDDSSNPAWNPLIRVEGKNKNAIERVPAFISVEL